MLTCKPLASPIATNVKFYKGGSSLFEDNSLYRHVVWSLQYLKLTWPDISFVVDKFYQYMHSPCLKHWVAVKLILRYLQHYKSFSFFILQSSCVSLQAFHRLLLGCHH
ncbi:hypothetical protein RND71_026569 [Anisodus tanguticus]|uniref:Uncharacterized protein n=1 Tax=Anisodus tanguticus TaxID=243964 RepID=A0AAE1RMM3_9SOLA|nr:hypothetical protein RND71_026569 [Anisodus tanguticus]